MLLLGDWPSLAMKLLSRISFLRISSGGSLQSEPQHRFRHWVTITVLKQQVKANTRSTREAIWTIRREFFMLILCRWYLLSHLKFTIQVDGVSGHFPIWSKVKSPSSSLFLRIEANDVDDEQFWEQNSRKQSDSVEKSPVLQSRRMVQLWVSRISLVGSLKLMLMLTAPK